MRTESPVVSTQPRPKQLVVLNPLDLPGLGQGVLLPSSDKTLHRLLAKAGDDLKAIERLLKVRLWRARIKHDQVILTVDTHKNEDASLGLLKNWAKAALQQPGVSVKIKESPKSECCKKACKGCMRGNEKIKACWR